MPFEIFHTFFLSAPYFENYKSYQLETSWVYRSHSGEVQCTRTVTLAVIISELLPFEIFMPPECQPSHNMSKQRKWHVTKGNYSKIMKARVTVYFTSSHWDLSTYEVSNWPGQEKSMKNFKGQWFRNYYSKSYGSFALHLSAYKVWSWYFL